MMHQHEKSDLVIVAIKPANKAKEAHCGASAGANAPESVERRAGAKGNTHQHNTYWTQSVARVTNALEHHGDFRRHTPEVGAYAGKPHVRFCAGGVR